MQVKVGKLYLVDLAGSERLKKSRSTGEGGACSAGRHAMHGHRAQARSCHSATQARSQGRGSAPCFACGRPASPAQACARPRPRASTCRSPRWACASRRAPTRSATCPSATPSSRAYCRCARFPPMVCAVPLVLEGGALNAAALSAPAAGGLTLNTHRNSCVWGGDLQRGGPQRALLQVSAPPLQHARGAPSARRRRNTSRPWGRAPGPRRRAATRAPPGDTARLNSICSGSTSAWGWPGCAPAACACCRFLPVRAAQESLGGNAKTTLLLCVADAKQHVDESLQTLQFGSRAMCVKNKPVVSKGEPSARGVVVCQFGSRAMCVKNKPVVSKGEPLTRGAVVCQFGSRAMCVKNKPVVSKGEPLTRGAVVCQFGSRAMCVKNKPVVSKGEPLTRGAVVCQFGSRAMHMRQEQARGELRRALGPGRRGLSI